ncbi:MAG: aminotransferase class I/II-fold pyridoxal phosphate-dependent enzyme [Lewinella sp.]|nr:aminotransferase class I/II-fold pyridoxal phosphate-dependent enzyme [Lewinella sp.]
MITFSGTAYLALDRHPQMQTWVAEGLSRYGLHYGGSRRSSLAPEVYSAAEAWLAEWTGAPAALLVGSGSLAGQWVTRQLQAWGYILHYSPSTHPALWRNGGQHHYNWASWQAAAHIPDSAMLTDAINPLTLSQPSWPEPFMTDANSYLVVDDSHGIGLLGEHARGHWSTLHPKWPGRLIITASLGKALSMPAGLILGECELIDTLRESPYFGGASPPPPAYIHALLQAEKLIREQWQQLQYLIDYFQRQRPSEIRVNSVPGFPVFGTPDHYLASHLLAQGFALSSFQYPGPADPCYTRVVLRADHTTRQIDRLFSAWKRVFGHTAD